MPEAVWYVAVGGKQYGPYSAEEIEARITRGQAGADTLLYGPGTANWTPLRAVPAFSRPAVARAPAPPPVPEEAGKADEVDYRIHGEEMQFVEVELDPGESAIAEAGAMMYMTSGIEMSTVLGDGSGRGSDRGLMGKVLGAGKRLLTGESLFITIFTNTGSGKAQVAFAAPYPGCILPMDLSQLGGALVCQKDSFLCAARGVSLGLAFQKRFGVGLFGGEGFIMELLEGDGLAFVHAGGHLHQRELGAGETVRVDTGCIVALERSVDYDIQFVGGIKTALFGGEGIFFATLTGPGRVWLQSLPFSRLAGRIYKAAPQTKGRRKGEGSVLDLVGGLGNLLDGD